MLAQNEQIFYDFCIFFKELLPKLRSEAVNNTEVVMRICIAVSDFCRSSGSLFFEDLSAALTGFAEVCVFRIHIQEKGNGELHEGAVARESAHGILRRDFYTEFRSASLSSDARLLDAASALRFCMEAELSRLAPDVVLCADPFAFLPFRFERNAVCAFFDEDLGDAANLSGFAADVRGNLVGMPAGNGAGGAALWGNLAFGGALSRLALEFCPLRLCYSDSAVKSLDIRSGGRGAGVVLPLALGKSFLQDMGIREEGAFCVGNPDESVPSDDSDAKKAFCEAPRTVLLVPSEQRASFDTAFFMQSLGVLGARFMERAGLSFVIAQKEVGATFLSPLLMEATLSAHVRFADFDALPSAEILVLSELTCKNYLLSQKAMARGALVLLLCPPEEPFIIEPGRNALCAPHEAASFASFMRDVVLDWQMYSFVRHNARAAVRLNSIKKCARAHRDLLLLFAGGRFSSLSQAYGAEFRTVRSLYKKSSDVEKIYAAEEERRLAWELLSECGTRGRGERILILTGSYTPPEDGQERRGVVFASVLCAEDTDLPFRMECLPFESRSFDAVYVCGAWEAVSSRTEALLELQRVAKSRIAIMQRVVRPWSWQFSAMPLAPDMEPLCAADWSLRRIPVQNAYARVLLTRVQPSAAPYLCAESPFAV
mgnify:FL=1